MSSMMAAMFWFTLLLAPSVYSLANCPLGCNCDDETLVVQCEESRLDVLPIALNPSIQRLVIRNNKIKTIDSSIQFYGELHFLDLSYNHLLNIPGKAFDNQKKLQELHLNHNKISNVMNRTFQGLNSLTVLNLRGNIMEELNRGVFILLPRLEELNLGQNRLTKIDPFAFEGLISLKVLYLDDNQLTAVPTPSFPLLSSLAELHVGLNSFYILNDNAFKGLQKLSVLDVRGAALTDVSNASFNGLNGLRALDLSGNRLNAIPTNELMNLNRLEELSLGQNQFESVPANAFKGLVNLRRLDITGAPNLVKVERDAFAENLNLENLVLSSNKKLSVIEDGALAGLPNLKHLILRENAFESFPESLLSWNELKKLELTDNPLHCGCELLWLRKLVEMKNFTSAQCFGPKHIRDRHLKTITFDELGCARIDPRQQAIVGALVVGSVALLTALLLLLYRYRRRVQETLKDYRFNKRAISRKEHEYQKTFSDEDYIVRQPQNGHFAIGGSMTAPMPPLRPIPVTEL